MLSIIVLRDMLRNILLNKVMLGGVILRDVMQCRNKDSITNPKYKLLHFLTTKFF